MSKITVDDFYNTEFEISGDDAKKFLDDDSRELSTEEQTDLSEALEYYQDTCRAD